MKLISNYCVNKAKGYLLHKKRGSSEQGETEISYSKRVVVLAAETQMFLKLKTRMEGTREAAGGDAGRHPRNRSIIKSSHRRFKPYHLGARTPCLI